MYPVLDAFEAYLDRKCGFVSYTFFCGRFLNSHSWKNHRSDLPQFRSFEMYLRSWAWCPVEHTRHFRWVTLFGMVKNVTPSKLGWWPPTIQWWKRVTTWITWRFFGMIFSWGCVFLVCFADGKLGIFHNDPVPCLPCETRCDHDESRRGSGHARVEPETSLGKGISWVKSRSRIEYMTTRLPKKVTCCLKQNGWFEGHDNMSVLFWDGRFLRDHVSFSGIHMKLEV